jgi:hypothetical protein
MIVLLLVAEIPQPGEHLVLVEHSVSAVVLHDILEERRIREPLGVHSDVELLLAEAACDSSAQLCRKIGAPWSCFECNPKAVL